MTAQTTDSELRAVLMEELRAVNDEVPEDVPFDQKLIAEIGIDSLDTIEFVARLEYRFQFVVPDEDWEQLTTLDEVLDYVKDHV